MIHHLAKIKSSLLTNDSIKWKFRVKIPGCYASNTWIVASSFTRGRIGLNSNTIIDGENPWTIARIEDALTLNPELVLFHA
jgi:hypothetical protein